MNLRNITIGLDYDTYIDLDNILRYQFQLRTRFICNFLSRRIREFKVNTSRQYSMISIALLPMGNEIKSTKIKYGDVLAVYLPFDDKKYEESISNEDYTYYLDLLHQGFVKASEFTTVPLEILLKLLHDFKEGEYKNEWIHKKKRFKDTDLEVVLRCEFTSNYFQLITIVSQISTKEKLAEGIALRTEPDEVLFDKMFKDILVDDKSIIITDASDSPRVLIDLKDVKRGIFNKKFAPYIYDDSYSEVENRRYEASHNNVVRILSYSGN
ncbi:hypothetical protein [Sphingobacterium siyangense]|uniref:hypothetical protein n=1 Tax=Sphingobacterium siyangense TaxID=459529 RepID=UPI00196655B1|nr:hypothetical protein [Sphingobacterium siyangense]QRY58010.1 hypothetical protein JVX97_00575 [Sphingobacterium siyangense]